MAIVYCDWTTGDDSTGNGSYGSPYKTITKASTGLTGGDEVRVAKSPAHTALTGTLTWTDNSTSVGTSADLTAVLSAGDMIGKDADDGMWYEVASLTSSAITLRYAYSGTSEAVVGYEMGFHDYGSPAGATTSLQSISASGSSESSLLLISGGWDLATQTQDGYSHFCVTHATNRYGIGLYSFSKNYVSVSRLMLHRCQTGISMSGTVAHLTDCMACSCGTAESMWLVQTDSKFTRVKGAGNLNRTILNITGRRNTVDDCTAVSCMSSIYYGCLTYYQTTIKKLTVRCCAGYGFCTEGSIVAGEVIAERCNSGVYLVFNNKLQVYKFGKLSLSSNTTGINWAYPGQVRVGTLILSSNTNDTSWVSTNYFSEPIMVVQRWNDTVNDSRMVYPFGVVYRNTAEARSGACLKAAPSSATEYVWVSLGKHRVTSVLADITLSIYAKDDATFNGDVGLMALMNGQIVSDGWVSKTMATSYGEHTLVVAAADLIDGEWLELMAQVRGTAGNVYFDDFSAA
jgi:hypothetical protein